MDKTESGARTGPHGDTAISLNRDVYQRAECTPALELD